MNKPIYQTGDGEQPINVDEALAEAKTAVDFKINHVMHQARIKAAKKGKKARKNRKK